MFTETVTATDGTTETGTATEWHAHVLLRRALKYRNCTVEATRTGGVVIEREVWDGGRVPKKRVITLEPVKPVGSITATMRRDLDAIGAQSAPYLVTEAFPQFRARVGRIAAGFDSIPPAATARLIDRGLVTVGTPWRGATSNGYLPETRATVRVSLAARLAMLAADHRTRASAPAGYVRPADVGMTHTVGLNKPGRRAGMVYDRLSRASCTCRGWTGTYDDADEARREARKHRQEATAAFVRALP